MPLIHCLIAVNSKLKYRFHSFYGAKQKQVTTESRGTWDYSGVNWQP